MILTYKDSPIMFDEDYLGTGMTRVTTLAHGELGFMWETPNGAWSAKIKESNYKHRIGNSIVALKWILENQPNGQ